MLVAAGVVKAGYETVVTAPQWVPALGQGVADHLAASVPFTDWREEEANAFVYAVADGLVAQGKAVLAGDPDAIGAIIFDVLAAKDTGRLAAAGRARIALIVANRRTVGPQAPSIAGAANLARQLRTDELANPLVESLRLTGELPPGYVTKAEAIAAGWSPGKGLDNHVPGGHLGGDVFQNADGILPSSISRVWYEADVGLTGAVTRSKQPGTRLLWSDDGLTYVTHDHYQTFYQLPNWTGS